MTNKITGTTETEPDGLVVIHSEAGGREFTCGPFDRRELLKALRAEPDETDYREVVEENDRLGRSVNRRASEARRVRTALGLPSSATVEDVLDAIRAAEDAAEAPEDAAEEPRDDQDQIDRSWALEKAGEVLGRLAAVGALPKDRAGVPVVAVAAWILDGEPVDRG